jgi:hypothetical protein
MVDQPHHYPELPLRLAEKIWNRHIGGGQYNTYDGMRYSVLLNPSSPILRMIASRVDISDQLISARGKEIRFRFKINSKLS